MKGSLLPRGEEGKGLDHPLQLLVLHLLPTYTPHGVGVGVGRNPSAVPLVSVQEAFLRLVKKCCPHNKQVWFSEHVSGPLHSFGACSDRAWSPLPAFSWREWSN